MQTKTVLDEICITDPRIQFIFRHAHIHGQIILDAGCGKGAMLAKFEQRDAITFGIDTDEKMLEIANKRLKSTRLIHGDLQDLNAENYYDVIVMSEVLEHCPGDWKGAINCMWRALKPGGQLFIIDKNNAAFWHKAWFFLNRVKMGKGIQDFIREKWFTENEVSDYLKTKSDAVAAEKLDSLFIGWYARKRKNG